MRLHCDRRCAPCNNMPMNCCKVLVGPRGATGPTGPIGPAGPTIPQTLEGIQYQLIGSEQATILSGAPIIFNSLITNTSPSITYDSITGIFQLSEVGLYYIAWTFASAGAGESDYVSLGVETIGGTTISNTSSIINSQISGTAIVDVTSVPQSIRLVNSTPTSIFVDVPPIQANITIIHLT